MYPTGLSLTFSLRFQPGNSARARSSTSRHSNGYFPHQGHRQNGNMVIIRRFVKVNKNFSLPCCYYTLVIERVP